MSEQTNTQDRRMTRRGSLARLGGLAAAALGTGAWSAGSSEGASADSTGPEGVATGVISCVLAPEQTEGPYYLPGDRVRRNVTEGRPGVPLALRLSVLDVSTCKPIKGAAVDIWHCDAQGVYSGVEQQNTVGQTFLRGIQKSDASGVVTFQTVYPGWYTGRTVHIHVRVFLGGNILHTGQLYFPDALTDTVYRRSPYNRRSARDMRNAADSIYRNGGSRSTLRLTKRGSGYVGRIAMGVQRT
jgi:protocatechuate 3,4-dioxygenase beta subunit